VIEPDNPKKGTDGQCEMLRVDVRKYNWQEMMREFNKVEPNDNAMLHAIHDVRIPILTVFKAAEKNAMRMNPQLVPANDIFPYIQMVVNRCLSVSAKVAEHGVPRHLTAEENWATGTNLIEATDRDLNHVEDIEEIKQSQWDFCERPKIHPKRTHAEKWSTRSEEGKKHLNAKNRSKQKLKLKRKKEEAALAANEN
jgi:hypothetical protein